MTETRIRDSVADEAAVRTAARGPANLAVSLGLFAVRGVGRTDPNATRDARHVSAFLSIEMS